MRNRPRSQVRAPQASLHTVHRRNRLEIHRRSPQVNHRLSRVRDLPRSLHRNLRRFHLLSPPVARLDSPRHRLLLSRVPAPLCSPRADRALSPALNQVHSQVLFLLVNQVLDHLHNLRINRRINRHLNRQANQVADQAHNLAIIRQGSPRLALRRSRLLDRAHSRLFALLVSPQVSLPLNRVLFPLGSLQADLARNQALSQAVSQVLAHLVSQVATHRPSPVLVRAVSHLLDPALNQVRIPRCSRVRSPLLSRLAVPLVSPVRNQQRDLPTSQQLRRQRSRHAGLPLNLLLHPLVSQRLSLPAGHLVNLVFSQA